MLDRTDLQLMLCEQIMDLDIDKLIELRTQLTGREPATPDSLETIAIADPKSLKDWLRFMVYVLGMRVKIPVSD